MLTPLKWKNEDQVRLLVATLALLRAARWNMDGSTCLSGGSLAQSLGGFIGIRLFVSAHALPSSLPTTMDE
jgi:hypothetical protein